MASIEITQPYVTYQCQTVLLDLAVQVALSRSKTKPAIKDAIQEATQIRLGLEALNYSSFLTAQTIQETLYLLSHIATVNAIPYAPTVTSISAPTILVGIQGPKGDTGSTGATGGGIAFSASNVSVDTVVDTFPITLAGAAEWTYDVHDASNKRVERLIGCWLPSGSSFVDDGGITIDPEIGSTADSISFFTNISAGQVQLIAHVVSGSWNINGSRVLIPVTGNGIVQPTSLTNGAIWIGDSSNQPVSQILSGNVTVSNTGVTTIANNCIVDAMVYGGAAIQVTKLEQLTASKAVVTNGSGYMTTSATSATEIGYLSGTTSNIQAQINALAIAGAITGAITTFVTANAAPSLAIVSNPAGKLAVSGVTSTELGYLSGVTSAIQTQINGKVSKTGDSMSGVLAMGSNKITGLAAATTNGDAVRYEQLPNVTIAEIPFSTGIATFSGDTSLSWNNSTKELLTGGLITDRNKYDRLANTFTLSGSVNDWAIGVGSFFRVNLSGTSSVNVSGIAGGSNGREIVIRNSDPGTAIGFLHNNPGSAVGNRIFLSIGTTQVIGYAHTITLRYDPIDQIWFDTSVR